MNVFNQTLLRALFLFMGQFLLDISFSQNSTIDSLNVVIRTGKNDTSIYRARTALARQYLLIGQYDTAIYIGKMVINSITESNSHGSASVTQNAAIQKMLAMAYNWIGIASIYKGDFDKSIEHHLKALSIREKLEDKQGIAASLNNIGNVYLQKGEFDKALPWYKKSLKISEEIGNKLMLSMTYNNIGLIYQDKNEFDSCFSYLISSLKLREEIKDVTHVAESYVNIGIYYNFKKDYQKAGEYFMKAIDIMNKNHDKRGLSVAYNNLGDIYLLQKKYEDAKKMQLLSLAAAKDIGSKTYIIYSYLSLSKCDSAIGNYREAYEYHKLYSDIQDSLKNEESEKSQQEMQTKYDTEKKEGEIKLLTKDGEIQKSQVRIQRIIIGAVVIGLLFVIAFAFLIFNRLKVTREQKLVIEEQKRTVDIKNKHITDSINYAKRIQDSILPSKEDLSKYFSDYFIFFRPRDIVSGDFYWYSNLAPNLSPKGEGGKDNGKAILVIADCTGHGVPGAFMSMIGNTLLNEIVNEQHVFQPADILNQLNEGIVKALHQESRSQDDGMDVSVCLFEKGKNKITFAGANHSLYVAHENSMREIKGDIHSIGSMFGQKSVSFTQHELVLQRDTSLFFTTDGFADQVGGEVGKKFLVRKLEKLFLAVSPLGAQEQEYAVQKAFEEWKGKRPQLDDILVAGIKV